MSDFTDWFRRLRKIWLVGAITAFALLWSIENPFFLCHPHWELLIREVAFALLISCVFGLTIEQIQRTEFIRLVTEERDKLKRDVFLYAYGFNLQDQIREEIRNSVLRSNFYRRDLTLDWEFSAPDAEGLMRVKKRYSYTLVNNSNDPALWPFRFSRIAAETTARQSTFNVLRIRHPDGRIEEIKPEPGDIYDPHKRVFSATVDIAGGEELGIHYEMTHVRRLYGDDNYSSREMIVGVTRVKLRFPENSTFEVSVSSKQKTLQKAPDGDPPTLYSFEFLEGLFPHQSIAISWSRKQEGGQA